MKRVGNIYQQIISIDNLNIADSKARKGKNAQYGVQQHNKNREANILLLHQMLKNKTYNTSDYTTFEIREPKLRVIFRLPYYPDRIAHHAVMNVTESIFTDSFTDDTYSCIKGKGIHAAQRAVERALKDAAGTQYCLKMDIRKFYPSVNHEILKALLRRKFKDADLLWLLDEIIDSTEGLPIGNYLSQYLANFYLSRFDHWLKEEKKVKYYFRYADDMVILGADKPMLHQLLFDIRTYLNDELKLELKDNYQVFPVDARGIDFVGYKFFHTHTLLRKSIKKNFAKAAKRKNNQKAIAGYLGWLKPANCINLKRTILNERSKV